MKLLRIVGALLLCLTLAPPNAWAGTILRLAYAENSQPVKDALRFFGERIAEKTDGEVTVQYFPDGQLGSERELVELTQVGVVDLTKVSSGLMESFSPLYGVFSLPYLFASKEEYYKVMDNPQVMEPVYQSTALRGFVGVGWYDSGARNFYMTKGPVKSVADLKGKKIRVMQSVTAINTMKLLGASPIAMSQAEVYTSLQQGILDGAENNEFALTIARHGEVARFYTYDMHTRIPDILVMSQQAIKKLSPQQLAMVKEALKESIDFEKSAWEAEIEKTRQQAVKDFNVEFNDVDKKPFQDAVKPIYDTLKEKPALYTLYQNIQAAK